MYELVIKKSRFIAYGYSINSKEEFKEYLLSLKKEHKGCKHIAYAYIINNGADGGFSDDGEPSGTAGKPIFNLLKIKDKDNYVIFVVRYRNGGKLGSSLLLRSYVNAAKEEI